MEPAPKTPRPAPTPLPDPGPGHDRLRDLRFRRLLGARRWARLPRPVRARFSRHLAAGESVTYAGRIVETRLSRLGQLLAQAARLLGAPLPLGGNRGGDAAVVTITEDAGGGGQFWTRLYARRRGFPQVIHSAKRFDGPTGLEEQVGGGVGMALTLEIEDDALLFRSSGYFLRLFGRRLPLPDWLTPGEITVGHRELGEGRFLFSLDVVHPRFGRLVRQSAIFEDAAPAMAVRPGPEGTAPRWRAGDLDAFDRMLDSGVVTRLPTPAGSTRRSRRSGGRPPAGGGGRS